MCYAARKDHGVDLATQHRGHLPDTLDDGETHKFESLCRLAVAGCGAVVKLAHGVGTRERYQTRMSDDEMPCLFVRVSSRVAEVDQIARRYSPRTFRCDGTLTVEGVVHVDDAPLAVRRHRDAASHVCHNEIQLLVRASHTLGIYACRGFLVERMKDRTSADLCHAAHLGHIDALIHNHRVGNVGLYAALLRDLVCDYGAQI